MISFSCGRIHRLVAVLILAAACTAQNPASRAADPGPLVADPGSGILAPVGWVVTPLFNLGAAVPNPADMVLGPGGHLYFTASSGASCGLPATTSVYRVLMSGTEVVPPATVQAFSTLPLDAHMLAYDAGGDALYAAGTCDQTTQVWRVSNTGVPAIVNPAQPLNDPDGVAVGWYSGLAAPSVFVAAQDQLWLLNLTTQVWLPITVNLAATGAATLGNWGSLHFDSATSTLLASSVGAPATYRTVELALAGSGPVTATATELHPTGLRPLCRDEHGSRLFGTGNQAGFLNPGTPLNTFQPVIQGLSGGARAVPLANGALLVLDQGSGAVHRLEPTMRSSALAISVLAGDTVTFSLKAQGGRSTEPYLVLASYHGSTPGITYAGVTAPVNYDLLTELAFIAVLAGDPHLIGWNGTLDSSGQAEAQVVIPPGILAPGYTLSFCFVLGTPWLASNAVWFHLLP